MIKNEGEFLNNFQPSHTLINKLTTIYQLYGETSNFEKYYRKELEKLSNVNKSTLSRIENNEIMPSVLILSTSIESSKLPFLIVFLLTL